MYSPTSVSLITSFDSSQTHLSLIEPQRNNRIPTPLHTLPDQPLHRLRSRSIHQIGEIPNLTPNTGLEECANISPPVPGTDGDAEDGAEDFYNPVAGEIVHGGCNNAVGVDEAARGFVIDGAFGQVCCR
jgi:hypothetical protein